MNDTGEDFDNLAWDKKDEEWEKVQPELRQRSAIGLVEALAAEKFHSPSSWYNIEYRLQVKGFSFDIIVRRPIPCYAQSPEENISIEAAIPSYIEKQSKIPNASVLFRGETPELGYYLIIKYIEH